LVACLRLVFAKTSLAVVINVLLCYITVSSLTVRQNMHPTCLAMHSMFISTARFAEKVMFNAVYHHLLVAP